MEIRIAYLYHNILNLYGTPSEVIVIQQQLQSQGIKVSVDYLELHDVIAFNKYDFIYLGASTEDNIFMCLDNLTKYREDIKKFIDKKIIYASGNSVNMFAKSIDNKQALHIFNFKAKKLQKRVISEVIMKHESIEEPVIGVINQSYILDTSKKSTFKLINSIEKYNSDFEGYEDKGFIGTNLVGPPICRNPYFAEYVVSKIIRSKYPEFQIKEFYLKEEKDAYDYFMYRFHQNI